MSMVRIIQKALVVGAITVSAAPVLAESFTELIMNCREIENRDRRYQCYDTAEASAANVNREVGDFNYQARTDPITGQIVHTLTIRSNRGLNSRGNPIIFELSCDSTRSGRYQLRLRWRSFLESRTPQITTRLGEQPSVTGTWDTDRRRETAILAGEESGYSKQEFIATLTDEVEAGNTTVVFRTRPYNAEPITAVFNFNGFLEVVRPMRESCDF